MVRVVLHRKRRKANLSPKQKGEVTPTPTLEPTSSDSSEDDDDFFIPDEDSPQMIGNASNTYLPQYIPTSSSSSSSSSNALTSSIRSSISLDRLDEEESPADAEVAVAILESFFFGGTSSTTSTTRSTNQCLSKDDPKISAIRKSNLPCSPTSTLIPPFPGSTVEQRTRYARHCHQSSDSLALKSSLVERTQSMPTMPPGSPARQPKKPVLKRTGSSTCSLNSSMKRNVSFTEVQFREYNVALSHHPSCSFGPPVELGWEYSETESLAVEDYEVGRSPRRETHQLLLSYNARRRMLLKQAGYSKEDLKAAEKEVDRVKRGRMMTEIFLPAQVIDESLERFVGFLKRTFKFRPERATAANE